MDSRRFFWFILGACALSFAATVLQLLAVYFMSLVEIPGAYDTFNVAIAAESDIGKIKSACLALTQLDASERDGRIKLMVLAPLVALLTSVVCAALAAWGLISSRKAAK